MARFRNEDVQMALNICAARAGYSLCPLQEQVIISFVQGSDVFVGLPTGSGKSLCYNILPDIFNSLRKVKSSIAVIVSHLMKDQVRAYMRNLPAPRLTLCAYVYARMQLIGAKIPLHIPSNFKNLVSLARPFFLPRACVEKTGWFTRLCGSHRPSSSAQGSAGLGYCCTNRFLGIGQCWFQLLLQLQAKLLSTGQ